MCHLVLVHAVCGRPIKTTRFCNNKDHHSSLRLSVAMCSAACFSLDLSTATRPRCWLSASLPRLAVASLLAVACQAWRSSAIIDSPVSMSLEIASIPAFSTSVSTSHQENSIFKERIARAYRSIFLAVSENSVQHVMVPPSAVTTMTYCAFSRYDKTVALAVTMIKVVRRKDKAHAIINWQSVLIKSHRFS